MELTIKRYEFWIYYKIMKTLESGDLYLDDSISHRCFEHELISLDKIKDINLPCFQKPIEKQIDMLFKELKKQWLLFDKLLKQNRLKHIKYNKKNKTISFHKPKIKKVEEPENSFYTEIPSVDIIDILRFVNKKTNFLSAFTPIQPKYVKNKLNEDVILAVIIAQSMNHGALKLSKISDISYKQLLDNYNKYFRNITLQNSNAIISNSMKELPIFEHYSYDLSTLYGSIDGQKLGVKNPTIRARHSKKYFGKDRGIVSITMLINYNPAMGYITGSNNHESYFIFDIYYNNTTDLVPEIITGDMHSINRANFAILNWFGVDFMPRFSNLKSQLKHLYCGDSVENYKNYYVKPVAQIDKDLIIKEWNPKIKQIIATLANKDITQSKIIKKLCSHKETRTLKAIFEYDKLVRSIYTLKYLRKIQLQRNVHRSQNRVESYHQLRSSISQINGRKQISGKTDIEIDVNNQCSRLIANAIIYYNSELLSLLLTKCHSSKNYKFIEKLKTISPVAWRHIHLLGHYVFCNKKESIDLELIVTELFSKGLI